MRLIILVNFVFQQQLAVARALAAGCARHGDNAEIINLWNGVPNESQFEGADAVCCWGWHRGQQHFQMGRRVLIMERAYVADRFTWVSLGWNGLNGRASFPRPDDGGARWRQHFAPLLCPWRTNSAGYALLMGQVPVDQSVRMINFKNWALATANQLVQLGYEVRFRPHPEASAMPRIPLPLAEGSLAEAIAGAAFVVTWNSNSGLDAVLSGTPAVTMDIGAMAWDVTSHDLASPVITPDREAWAHRLAFTQWLPEEIERGEAWEHLRQLP